MEFNSKSNKQVIHFISRKQSENGSQATVGVHDLESMTNFSNPGYSTSIQTDRQLSIQNDHNDSRYGRDIPTACKASEGAVGGDVPTTKSVLTASPSSSNDNEYSSMPTVSTSSLGVGADPVVYDNLTRFDNASYMQPKEINKVVDNDNDDVYENMTVNNSAMKYNKA